MKTPGPDHPIAITPHHGRVCVWVGGVVVAETERALRLEEASYPAVYYIPREDADQARFETAGDRTHCPYKGDARYFTIVAGVDRRVKAAWSYDDPYPSVARIAGHLAFYPDRVDAIEVS